MQNGDQIEILTTKSQKPSEDWLRFVTTSKAKARIKDLIKEENKQYLVDGKAIIEKRCKILRLEVTNELTNQLRAYFNCKTPNDLYYKFGKGYVNVDEIRKFKQDKEAKQNIQAKLNTDNLQEGKLVGKELKKIHNLPLSAEFDQNAWPKFLEEQAKGCVARHTRIGLREDLETLSIDQWIQNVKEFLDAQHQCETLLSNL